MKKLTALISIAAFCVSQNLYAQHRCGTDEWLQQHPAEAAKIQAAMQPVFQANMQSAKRQATVTIPIVVHVVYNTQAQNISDEQVRSQIDALNEDFRRMNADTFRTQEVFKQIAADAQIEIRLALRDPNGNPTTGITRTATSVTSFTTSGDYVKFDSTGGKTAWDTDKYLNIWVCNFTAGGVFGYATMPGVTGGTDGVVIKYTAFGRTGSVQHPFNLGRTATHEIGHWLGLYHPFLGGCSGMNASNCATEGDFICDTPPVVMENYSCKASVNTCEETPVDKPDQIENFMDYSDDRCMNMFTQGQVAVMQTALNTLRNGILSSPALQPADIVNAGIDLVESPASGICSEMITPKIKLTNYGLNTLSSATIEYKIGNGTPSTYYWIGSLGSLESQIISLDEIEVGTGSQSFTAYISGANNTTDAFSGNDTVVKSFTVASAAVETIPYSEDFSGNYFPPIGWENENPDVSIGWAIGNNAVGSDGENTKVAYVNFYLYDIIGEQDALISPVLDLSGSSQPELSFDLACASMTDLSKLQYGKFEVQVATDCQEFFPVMSTTGNDLLTVSSPQSNNWGPNSTSVWKKQTVDLSAFAGKQIKIMFRTQNGLSNNLFIDNVNVAEKTTTGIQGFNSENTLRVYPNPSHDGIFYLSGNAHLEDAIIEVYNSLGAIVYKGKVAGENSFINLSDKASGYFSVHVITTEQIFTATLVKSE